MSKKSKQATKANKSQAKQPQSQQPNAVQVTQEQRFSGPIPSPEDLQSYADISPDLVNRIVAMAENEASTRHSKELKTLDANIKIADGFTRERRLGQIFGIVIGLAGLGSAVALGISGATGTASIIGGSTVVGLVGIFVIGKFMEQSS